MRALFITDALRPYRGAVEAIFSLGLNFWFVSDQDEAVRLLNATSFDLVVIGAAGAWSPMPYVLPKLLPKCPPLLVLAPSLAGYERLHQARRTRIVLLPDREGRAEHAAIELLSAGQRTVTSKSRGR